MTIQRRSTLSRRQLLQGMGAALAGFATLGWSSVAARPLVPQAVRPPSLPAAQDDEQEILPGRPRPLFETIVGVLERVELPSRAFIRTPQATMAVELIAGSVVWHALHEGGASLTSFVPGEWVIIEGYREGELFQATALKSTPFILQGLVTDVIGEQIQSTVGVIELSPATLDVDGDAYLRAGRVRRKPRRPFARDQSIVADVWLDPSTGRFKARKIGLLEEAS